MQRFIPFTTYLAGDLYACPSDIFAYTRLLVCDARTVGVFLFAAWLHAGPRRRSSRRFNVNSSFQDRGALSPARGTRSPARNSYSVVARARARRRPRGRGTACSGGGVRCPENRCITSVCYSCRAWSWRWRDPREGGGAAHPRARPRGELRCRRRGCAGSLEPGGSPAARVAGGAVLRVPALDAPPPTDVTHRYDGVPAASLQVAGGSHYGPSR